LNHSSINSRDRHTVKETDPVDAYEKLVVCKKSFLVDVRSQAEWNFVGFPHSVKMKNEVIFCEWSSFPTMTKSLNFLDELIQKINFKKLKIYIFFVVPVLDHFKQLQISRILSIILLRNLEICHV